jgi:flagellar FliJ protein
MENILDYRRNIEEDEKQKFSKLQREYILQKSILNDLEEKLQKANNSLLGYIQDTVKLKNHQKYINFLRERIGIQKQHINKLESGLDLKRKEMVFAQRERKIIEKHRERSFMEYTNAVNKLEQKNIDELALYTYMRR